MIGDHQELKTSHNLKMEKAILSSNIVCADEKHQAEEREQLPSIIVWNLRPSPTFRLFKEIKDSQSVKQRVMAKFLEFLFTVNVHEFGCLQTKTSWVTKSNLSVSTATQLIVAPNDYDYATFSIGRQRLSMSSKPPKLFFHHCFEAKAAHTSNCWHEQFLPEKALHYAVGITRAPFLEKSMKKKKKKKKVWLGSQSTYSYGLFPSISAHKNEKGWEGTSL